MKRCAMCGSRRITRKAVSVRLKSGHTVRGVPADVCAACGEQFFDIRAMDKIEAARERVRGG
jgi:YgiT-type zinc finger domain-containing protein